VSFNSKFKIWPFYYCVYGTSLSTKTTKNTFSHVNIVTSILNFEIRHLIAKTIRDRVNR